MSAIKLCHGTLSERAASAVGFLTGQKTYAAQDPDSPDKAADALATSYVPGIASAPDESRHACSIQKPGSVGEPYLQINVQFADEADADEAADTSAENRRNLEGLQYLDQGNTALASGRFAELYFKCVSPELKSSSETTPALVAVTLEAGAGVQALHPPEKATEEVREANLAVVHSVAYRIARHWNCADEAKLSATPVLKRVPVSASSSG
ncbi:hypothetical protein [Streptomyces sp. DW26H14]|uniref:hypothetical protein n=1 Tax=Streptomyces sp. DW26H14 TaxID=3435395 RepID=UPI00403D77D2